MAFPDLGVGQLVSQRELY